MITYTSIRLYISSPASILPNSFYDVVGFYGAQVGTSTNPYHIDRDFNSPVIKANGSYYYLTYRDTDGFIPNVVEFGDTRLTLLEGSTQMPIYLNQRDDAHIISSYDSPLGANITIDNLSSAYVAYRILTVEVYDNYAIESFGPIVDNHNIIDVVDADFVLAATNEDQISIVPSSGNVNSLFSFTVTYVGRTITAADISMLRKIALYDYNTQAVAVGVDVNSITYTLGQENTIVTFSLLSEITSPSLYFLYIPSGSFTYSTGKISKIAMFAYNIKAISGGGDIFEFIYSPTQTKRLKTVELTYVNVLSINGVSWLDPVILSDGTNTTSFNGSEVLDSAGNQVTITLPETIINNTNENQHYTITLAAGAVIVRENQANSEPIILEITLVPENSTIAETDDYTIEVIPSTGEVYDVSYLNISISFKENITGRVVRTDGHEFSEIVVYELSTEGQIVDRVVKVESSGNGHLNDNNLYTFDFNCRFARRNNTALSYVVKVPAELFEITAYKNGTSETTYNGDLIIPYTIKQLPPQDEEDPDETVTSFDYKLLTVIGAEGVNREHVVFRPAGTDSIIINRDNFEQLLTCPCLSVTKLDHANADSVLSKETLALVPGDTMSVTVRTTYYNTQYVEVSTTATMDYGYINGSPENSDMSSVFPIFRSGYPNYFKLTYIFNYNGTELTRTIEIQLLPDYIFEQFRANQAWKKNLRFDLYSGTQTDYQYGCMFLTHEYDVVLSYKTKETQNGEPTEVTHYVAELVPTTKVRTGNLRGIYNETFGANQPQGFGLYGESVYLTGNFYLNNGKSLMDISDDILLANGNINEIRDGLNNLDTSVKATIEALSLRQETFENGLDASIKSYISTNKNAVLKIGLDYSLWSLGSAGIAMINPNATYDFDPISGNYTVSPSTVGDGDEYIAMQGSKIKFSTYSKEYIKTATDDKEYIEVICTTISPELWLYPDSIYIPKKLQGTAFHEIEFFTGYVEELPDTVNSINIQDSTVEFLKYVRFEKAMIGDEGNFLPSLGEDQEERSEENAEYYTFANYYACTTGTVNNTPTEAVRLKEPTETQDVYTLTNALSRVGSNATIFYVPRVVLAGMFKDGKFNADYIEARNLVAVDTNPVQEIVYENNQPVVDDDGNIVKQWVKKYRKNPRFNPLARIVSDPNDPEYNYPVLNINDNNPAKDASFVVVSGSTGKITARGADIRGTIIVGDETSTEDGGYLLLSDGTSELAQGSGLFLFSRKDGNTHLAATFNGAQLDNPTEEFKSFETLAETSSQGRKSRYTTATAKASGRRVWQSTGSGGGTVNPNEPLNPYDNGFGHEIPGVNGGDEPGTHNGGSSGSNNGYYWYNWYVSYSHNATFCGKLVSSPDTYCFRLGANERVVLKVTAGTLKGYVRYSGSPNGSGTGARAYTQLAIVDDSDNIYYTSYRTVDSTSASGAEVAATPPTNLAGTEITFTNPFSYAKTFYIGYKMTLSFYYSDDNNDSPNPNTTSAPSVGYGTNYPPVTITGKVEVTNLIISKGSEGFTTNLFGNGLTVGYNYRNYFSTYFLPDPNSPKMILDFKCSGTGMKFNDGAFSYYIFNKVIPAFITIIKGKVYPKVENVTLSGASNALSVVFYYFNGFTALSTYNNDSFYAHTTSTKYLVRRPPFISNYYRAAEGILWWYTPPEDHRGEVYNTINSLPANVSGDTFFACTYYDTLDLFIVAISSGSILIALGEKWNDLFVGRKAFLQDINTKITATGIGKGAWNGSNATNVPYGSVFPMVKPTFTSEDGITCPNGRDKFTIYSTSGGNATITYNGVSTNTPKICNAIQIDLADDESFNDGAFYLNVDLCPNNFTVS